MYDPLYKDVDIPIVTGPCEFLVMYDSITPLSDTELLQDPVNF